MTEDQTSRSRGDSGPESAEDATRPTLSHRLTSPEMLIGLSAVLLSLCGLFIAIYEASLIRTAQRASAWPHVEVLASLTPERVRLWVHNTGTGPARIRAASVEHEGEVKSGWNELTRSVSEGRPRVDAYQSMIQGRVLPVSSEPEVLFAVTEDDGPGARELIAELRRAILEGAVDVDVCYCSVYDECWAASLQDYLERFKGDGHDPGELLPRGSRQVPDCSGATVSRV